ncbi:hypothetical protein CT0861_05703 [Colletotrichum tofieldiae]|uniref:Uncharacterized protein n=1 Tax=Colletotrichum tofieldiae TaxID=708197 RepID=A0A166XG44_9PEZI|nr:hypothetical protein CT0861_05703 [Colletotrichum tofieldiae]
MDYFTKLPAELRVEIIMLVRSRRTILQLIQASPVMLGQYIMSKGYITRALLTSDLDDEMIQDAMAIIIFPSKCSTKHFATLASLHCRSWAAQQLGNPFREPSEDRNRRLIEKLNKLHGRLLFFIEDYLTKATAVFPPREYICLSGLSPVQTQLTFKGHSVSTRFDAANLTGPERKRLLRAFLRCQLRSVIHRDGDWDSIGCCMKELYQYRGQQFQPFDREAILCVHTYLGALYGAMFAQCSNSWLPEITPDSTSSDTPGMLYPDNLYVNPNTYASDMGWQRKDFPLASSLAGFGFDLVTTFLRSATAGRHGRDRLKQWFMDVCPARKRGITFEWTCLDYLYLGDYQVGAEDDDYQNCPGMYQMLYPLISDSFQMHKNIYRQRAWVFFDDARFYLSHGSKPHFPTRNELEKEQSDTIGLDEGWFLNPAHTRALHRSQKWHDEQRGRFPDEREVEKPQDSELDKEHQVSLPSVIDVRYFSILRPFWN